MQKRKTYLDNICNRIAEYLDILSEDIIGRSRKEIHVDGRQAFSILAYYSSYTYQEIGDYLDNRNHDAPLRLVKERPFTKNSLNAMTHFLRDDKLGIKNLSKQVYNNPNDERAREILKQSL